MNCLEERFIVDKSFEITVKFRRSVEGVLYPIVNTIVILPNGDTPRWPLLLDTGADGLILHPTFKSLFSNTEPENFKGIGGAEHEGAKTQGKIKLFGRTVECEIGFVDFELLSYRVGFLGRECLKTFGIGFWESASEFYVTLTP